jgi:hypothetical protein
VRRLNFLTSEISNAAFNAARAGPDVDDIVLCGMEIYRKSALGRVLARFGAAA